MIIYGLLEETIQGEERISEETKWKIEEVEEDLLDRSNGFANRKRYCQE